MSPEPGDLIMEHRSPEQEATAGSMMSLGFSVLGMDFLGIPGERILIGGLLIGVLTGLTVFYLRRDQ